MLRERCGSIELKRSNASKSKALENIHVHISEGALSGILCSSEQLFCASTTARQIKEHH